MEDHRLCEKDSLVCFSVLVPSILMMSSLSFRVSNERTN